MPFTPPTFSKLSPRFALPPLYAIADIDTLARQGMTLTQFVRELTTAGVAIVQLRDKRGSPQRVLAHAAEMTAALVGSQCLPVMNDRADLAVLAGWQAVHVGHADLPPAAVRRVFGEVPALVGVSTHDEEQVRIADAGEADYVAVGPVFATGTKADAQPVIGLDGLRRARALTHKPLVAIGGITLETARAVREAGADSVAVIGGLFRPGERLGETLRELLSAVR